MLYENGADIYLIGRKSVGCDHRSVYQQTSTIRLRVRNRLILPISFPYHEIPCMLSEALANVNLWFAILRFLVSADVAGLLEAHYSIAAGNIIPTRILRWAMILFVARHSRRVFRLRSPCARAFGWRSKSETTTACNRNDYNPPLSVLIISA